MIRKADQFQKTFCAHNAVKAVEYAVRNVSIASSCKYRKVSYEKFNFSTLYPNNPFKLDVELLERFIFPVPYPEGEAEASGLRPQTYLPDRTII